MPAKVLADTAKALTGGTEVTIALSRRSGGAGEGIIGFEGSAGGGVRRTTTRLLDGEFPKVRSLFPSEHLTVARVDRAAAGRVGQAGLAGRRAQHRGPAGVHRRACSPWTPAAATRRMATESIEADVTGEDITTGFNPAFLLDGLTAIEAPFVELRLHPGHQARRALGRGLASTATPTATSATC